MQRKTQIKQRTLTQTKKLDGIHLHKLCLYAMYCKVFSTHTVLILTPDTTHKLHCCITWQIASQHTNAKLLDGTAKSSIQAVLFALR